MSYGAIVIDSVSEQARIVFSTTHSRSSRVKVSVVSDIQFYFDPSMIEPTAANHVL